MLRGCSLFKVNFSSNINPKKALGKLRKDKHLGEFEKLTKSAIYVGFPSSAKNKDGLTIAKYARYNNYGTYTHDGGLGSGERIPARPFFTLGFYFPKYQEKRSKLAKELVRQISKGLIKSDEAATLMGIEAVNNVRDSILNGPWRPNSPRTAARKMAKSRGKKSKFGVKPLVDTGDMISAVTYIIGDQNESNNSTVH